MHRPMLRTEGIRRAIAAALLLGTAACSIDISQPHANQQPDSTASNSAPKGGLFVWSRESGFFLVAPPSGYTITPRDINDTGEILGVASGGNGINPNRTFIWSAARGFEYVGGAQLTSFLPARLNAAGSVTGWTQNGLSLDQAFVWNRNSGVTLIPTAMSRSNMDYRASSINSLGWVTGSASGDTTFAFRWTPQGQTELLRGSADFPASFALDVNDFGDVLGYEAALENGKTTGSNPVMWNSAGEPTELLPDCGGECQRTVVAINNRREIAGSFDGRTFRRSAAGSFTYMPGPPVTVAIAMNDAGDVLLGPATDRDVGRASVWTASGEVIPLGLPSGVNAIRAVAINNNGTVVGWYGVR